MNNRIIEKEIDCLRDSKNHLWTALVVSITGTLTLIFNLNNILKITFFIIGLLFSTIFLYGYFKKDDDIENLYKKLKKE